MENQICENVFHWLFPADPSIADAQALGAAIVAWYPANLSSVQASSVLFNRIKFTNLTSATAFSFEYTTGLPLAGSLPGAIMPNNVALVVKWTTANRGRSFRGRTYHLGLDETNVGGSSVVAGYATSLTTAYTNYRTLVVVPQPTLVVASFFSNNAPRATATLTPIIGESVETVIDSQRRRLPGRGS